MIWANGEFACLAVGKLVKRVDNMQYYFISFHYHTSKQMATYGYKPIGPKELMKWKS